ncbi:MAG TPA: GuaB1 family IMP dehydrogenase-related protein [Microbacteriaceae bacterium]|nr:GuaB1 family IMP dehydrogenase-related protein [Microbacteriaceae bacterium]
MEFTNAHARHDLTYSDVFLVPSRSGVKSRFDVNLSTPDNTGMTIPLVSANMNSVTGPRLAAALARRGGLGVLPQDLSLDDTLQAVAWVKAQSPLWDTPFVLDEDATVADARELVPPIAGVTIQSRAGLLDAAALEHASADATIAELTGAASFTLDASNIDRGRGAFDALYAAGVTSAPVVADGRIVGALSRKSALRNTVFEPAVDAQGRLRVAVAIGVNADVATRARALVDAGVDVLVMDTAHGHQEAMVRALETVAALDLGVPIVAGNIVTSDAARDLVAAGANILKVGVGPGAMCTTRMMTAVGRPQFSAVLDAAETARELGAHVWADGGVRYPRDVALALAAGSSAVMIGSWFAGTVEAPGVVRRDAAGALYKESWGMASTKAVRARFAALDPFERERKELYAEGISSSSIYLDPLRPTLDDLLDMITAGVRSSFTYAGAQTVTEFHARARVGIQSAAGYEEGKALPVSW